MSSVTILGKVNEKMEFISVNKIKGSFIRTMKQMGGKDSVLVIDWPMWHMLSTKVQKRHNFVIFSERADWAEDVWTTDRGESLFTSPFFGSSNVVVVGGGEHIRRVIDSIGPTCSIPKIVVVPSLVNRSGTYSLLGHKSDYYRDVSDMNDTVQTYLF